MLCAELIKLKRSSTWIIALVLPLLAVVTGTVNYVVNSETLDAGWSSFISQVTLFYGLLFSSMGIALLAATVWRIEHRGTNWNLLLTSTRQSIKLVLAKVVVIVVAVACMQGVLVAGTLSSGALVLRLDDGIPWEFPLVGVLAIAAALPLITLQSLLSILLKSFAAPVALCLAGCAFGVASVTSVGLRPVSYLLPQAINTRALSLGSTALAESGGLTLSHSAMILFPAIAIAAIVVASTCRAITAIKLR